MLRHLHKIALAAVLLAGCATGGEPVTDPSGGPQQPTTSTEVTMEEPTAETMPAPRRLTPEDDGSTFTMTVGQVSALLVRDPRAPDPTVAGDAVEVAPVDNVTASGVREFELRALRPGRTVLSSTQDPPYTITLEVRD